MNEPALSPALRERLDAIDAAAPDGSDAGPCVAYLEMTLEFANADSQVREARGQLVLPPGGVASRLTLWIDGEEREAAFGTRATVREAYRRVAVVRRRDPALLTTAGPDRVQLQCFPIPAGGTMKVKAGFTLPLIPDGEEAVLHLPYFAETNFLVAPEQDSAFWVESRARLRIDAGRARPEIGGEEGEKRADGFSSAHGEDAAAAPRRFFAVRGRLPVVDWASTRVRAPLPPAGTAYTGELAGVKGAARVERATPLARRLVVFVLDTSAVCEPVLRSMPGGTAGKSAARGDPPGRAWESLLAAVPDGVRVALVAGEQLALPAATAAEARRTWPDAVRGLAFLGADEQVGALEKAWDMAAAEPDAAILWLHGALPVELADVSGLAQRFRRRPGTSDSHNPRFFSLQLLPGPNRIEEKLESAAGLVRLPSWEGEGTPDRLERWLRGLAYPELTPTTIVYALTEEGAPSSSPHIARLAFARHLVRRMARETPARDDADTATALRLRLVTPVTGAVVLENQAQYEAHDLDPARDRASVPVIPEPEEWLLFLTAGMALAALYVRKRREAVRPGRAA